MQSWGQTAAIALSVRSQEATRFFGRHGFCLAHAYLCRHLQRVPVKMLPAGEEDKHDIAV
jgi:hypothetical protein